METTCSSYVFTWLSEQNSAISRDSTATTIPKLLSLMRSRVLRRPLDSSSMKITFNPSWVGRLSRWHPCAWFTEWGKMHIRRDSITVMDCLSWLTLRGGIQPGPNCHHRLGHHIDVCSMLGVLQVWLISVGVERKCAAAVLIAGLCKCSKVMLPGRMPWC